MIHSRVRAFQRRLTVLRGWALLLCGLGSISSVYAASGEVNITGNIVSNTCNVSVLDQDKVVNMGTVSNKQFLDGKTTAAPKAFVLSLVNCGPAASGVSVEFQGNEDANNHELLALGGGTSMATGLGIALLDSNKVRIPINTRTTTYAVTPNTTLMVLKFYAQYTADGASVTSGGANATATFNFVYD